MCLVLMTILHLVHYVFSQLYTLDIENYVVYYKVETRVYRQTTRQHTELRGILQS